MDEQTQSELKRLATKIGIWTGVFLAGAACSFVYSYVPLHNAKNWKIDYLAERLASKDERVKTLEQSLTELQVDAADKPDSETFKLLQDELVTTDKTIQDLERKLAKSEKRVKDLERSRKSWQSKHAAAEAKIEELGNRRAGGAATAPASPAPGGEPEASDLEVGVGKSWVSPDGQASFELIGVSAGRAKIIADPATNAAGSVPKVIEVEEGGQFRIGLASDSPMQVWIRRINGNASITVDLSS